MGKAGFDPFFFYVFLSCESVWQSFKSAPQKRLNQKYEPPLGVSNFCRTLTNDDVWIFNVPKKSLVIQGGRELPQKNRRHSDRSGHVPTNIVDLKVGIFDST